MSWREVLSKEGPVPRDKDDDRYIQSFDVVLDEKGVCISQDAREFFNYYGFVVLSNIFNAEQCQKTRDAFWEIAEEINTGFDHKIPESWAKLKSAGKYGLFSRGPCFHREMVLNRQNDKLIGALAMLVGCNLDDLMVSQDRFVIYRPTVNEEGVYDETLATGLFLSHCLIAVILTS